MPLNSSKLDAIRAKLTATAAQIESDNQVMDELSKSSLQRKEQTNALPATIPSRTNEQTGKANVTSQLVALEASATTKAINIGSKSPQQESAGTINFQAVVDKITELQEAIHTAHPRMPQLLHDIWSTVHKYPEQVTLLSEEQMEVVFSGLEKIVDTDLAAITLKSATKSGGKKAPVTNAALGF